MSHQRLNELQRSPRYTALGYCFDRKSRNHECAELYSTLLVNSAIAYCSAYLVEELECLLVLLGFELIEELVAARLVRHAVDRGHEGLRSHHSGRNTSSWWRNRSCFCAYTLAGDKVVRLLM